MEDNQVRQYEVPEVGLGWLNEKIAKLNKKAVKLGCQPIEIIIVGEFYKDIEEKDEEGYKTVKTVKYHTVEVKGERPILNGWQFVATLQHQYENGTIVRTVAGETIPQRYYTAGSICEHCNSKRLRKDTYVVKNIETGEYKQVGKSCLKDFLGHSNPERYASYSEWLINVEDLIQESNKVNDINMEHTYIATEEFLQMANEVINKHGFISRSKAQEMDCRVETTAYRTHRELYPTSDDIRYNRVENLQITEESIKLVEEVLAWIKGLDTTQAPYNSEYFHNLQVLAKSRYVGYSQLGYLASLITAYKKAMEIIKVKEKQTEAKAKSEYVGTVGDRAVFDLTVDKVILIDTQFGLMKIHLMSDNDGNRIVWSTTSTTLEEGKQYTLKGTIKDHREYKSEKQTELSRCKVVGE